MDDWLILDLNNRQDLVETLANIIKYELTDLELHQLTAATWDDEPSEIDPSISRGEIRL